jgi:hypothetical protein
MLRETASSGDTRFMRAMMKWMRAGSWVFTGMIVVGTTQMQAQQQVMPTAKDVVAQMLENEKAAISKRGMYEYVSLEKSERTGGHLWMEHVVETPEGRIRFLMQEDGKPLPPEREAQERGRLADILAHESEFEAKERSQKNDEESARKMMSILPKAFLLENMREEGPYWHIDLRPDPNYSPDGMTEKVAHAMSGYVLIDRKELRIRHLEGHLPTDLSIGFGILATVHAGTHFVTERSEVGDEWRTTHVVSVINGRIIFFKTLNKNQDMVRQQFHKLEKPLTLKEAVALAETEPR